MGIHKKQKVRQRMSWGSKVSNLSWQGERHGYGSKGESISSRVVGVKGEKQRVRVQAVSDYTESKYTWKEMIPRKVMVPSHFDLIRNGWGERWFWFYQGKYGCTFSRVMYDLHLVNGLTGCSMTQTEPPDSNCIRVKWQNLTVQCNLTVPSCVWVCAMCMIAWFPVC